LIKFNINNHNENIIKIINALEEILSFATHTMLQLATTTLEEILSFATHNVATGYTTTLEEILSFATHNVYNWLQLPDHLRSLIELV